MGDHILIGDPYKTSMGPSDVYGPAAMDVTTIWLTDTKALYNRKL